MKKIWNLFLALLLCNAAEAQYGFDITKDQNTGQTMYVGRCTFDDLNDEASFSWLTTSSNSYNPDPLVVEELKKNLPSCNLVIFMGTWCEDTQNLLPKLYKTMLLAHCFTNYNMYAVDRNKVSKENEQQAYGVTMVPTIIVTKNGKELGRIVENAKTTVEADLLRISESEGKPLQMTTPVSHMKTGVDPNAKKQAAEDDESDEKDED
ncbi:MAG: thioredoxin family protein [Chitinophagaceae bacterium]